MEVYPCCGSCEYIFTVVNWTLTTSLWENSSHCFQHQFIDNAYTKFDLLIHFKPHLRCINNPRIDFELEKKAHDFELHFSDFQFQPTNLVALCIQSYIIRPTAKKITLLSTQMWHYNKCIKRSNIMQLVLSNPLDWQTIHPYRRPKDAAQGNGCKLTHNSPQSSLFLAMEQPVPALCVASSLYCLSQVAANPQHWNILVATFLHFSISVYYKNIWYWKVLFLVAIKILLSTGQHWTLHALFPLYTLDIVKVNTPQFP